MAAWRAFAGLRTILSLTFFSVTVCAVIKMCGIFRIIPWTIAYTDFPQWVTYAFSYGFPYLNKSVAYPLVLGLVMHVASRGTLTWYYLFYYLLLTACALLSAYLLYQMGRQRGIDKKYLLLCFAVAPSMLWYSYINWDMVAVLFSVLALYYYQRERTTVGTIFLALGFLTKLYPILFFLPVLLRLSRRQKIIQCGVFMGTFLALNGYFMIKSFRIWVFTFGFHESRWPNIDNIWAVVHRIFPSLTLETINLLSAALFFGLYLFLTIRYRKEDMSLAWLLALFPFLLFNKIFSPQYVLWMLPLIVLLGVDLRTYYALEFSNLAVLFSTLIVIFAPQPPLVAVFFSTFFVLMRHILLGVLLYQYLSRIRAGSVPSLPHYLSKTHTHSLSASS